MDSRKKKLSKKASKKQSKKPSKRMLTLPKTARATSKRSAARAIVSRANSQQSLTDLQTLAKSRGIPFGGLTKTKLIRKINNYY